MKAGSAPARKGREFQQEVACDIARSFGWTVEALVPRAVGKVVKGVRYVAEHDSPDLRVRTSGAAGPDVVPLSARAAAAFPFMVECKIRHSLPAFWPYLAGGTEAAFWREWVAQACEHCRGGRVATARLSKPLVVSRANLTTARGDMLSAGTYAGGGRPSPSQRAAPHTAARDKYEPVNEGRRLGEAIRRRDRRGRRSQKGGDMREVLHWYIRKPSIRI